MMKSVTLKKIISISKIKTMIKTDSIDEQVRDLVMPATHIEIRRVKAKDTVLLAARGTFKTSRGIALYIMEMVEDMPGSTGVGIGLSFEHLERNTLPPLRLGFIDLGWIEGVDFIIGKKPPEDWDKPILGVVNNNYKHTISFPNGCVIQLISLMVKASANGVSAQWGFFDEAKFMNEKELASEIFPIFRGLDHLFKHCHGYLSKFFATDKLADPAQIKWLLKKRKKNDTKRVSVILALQAKLDELNIQLENAGINASAKLKRQIFEIDQKLLKLRSNMTYVWEISAEEVRPIMGEDWWKALIRNVTGYEYKVAIMNFDPDKPEVAFYPDFDETRHVHNFSNDYDPNRPLIIALDYQQSVSPICIAQIVKLQGMEDLCLNYCDEVYTLANPTDTPSPNGNGSKGELQEAVELFYKRYRGHMKKVVFYVYDSTAKGKRVNADKYYETVQRILKQKPHRWSVVMIDTGKQPGHYQKFIDTKDWMLEKTRKDMPIRISARCEKTIISISSAAAMTVKDETKKDKRAETDEGIDQSETTHFSDTFDMLNHAVLKLKMVKPKMEKKPLGFGRAAA
jgi:hypothetical protein